MTQKFELVLVPCTACGSIDFNQTVLGNSLADASDFANNDEEQSLFRYETVTCPRCGHSSIQTNNPCWMPTRKHEIIKYGEPIEEYPKTVEILGSLNPEFNDESIHTFSFKNFQLANLLASELNIPSLELKDFAVCSRKIDNIVSIRKL